MKRTLKLFVVASAALALASSCDKPVKDPDPVRLDVPSPAVAVAGIDNVTILWEEIKGAESYEILLNGTQKYDITGISATIDGLSSDTKYSLVMKAIAPEGSKQWLDSDYSEPLEFTTKKKAALDAPVLSVRNLGPDGFELYWNAVKNAVQYECVGPDGSVVTTKETSQVYKGLNYGTEYTVKVKACPDPASTYAESSWSERKVKTADRTALATPVLSKSDVHTNGFTVSWAAVPDAAKYIYKIGSGAEQTTTDLKAVFGELTAKTDYIVSVCAAPAEGDAGKFVASQWADIKVTTLDLVVLGTPVLKSENVLATEFTVTWPAVEHAGAYMVSFNGGAASKVSATSVKYEDLSTETLYTVTVQAVPADSQTGTYKAGQTAEIKVTTKSGPSKDDKDGNIDDFDEDMIF